MKTSPLAFVNEVHIMKIAANSSRFNGTSPVDFPYSSMPQRIGGVPKRVQGQLDHLHDAVVLSQSPGWFVLMEVRHG